MASSPLTPFAFRQLCIEHQFQLLAPIQKFIDIRFPRSGYIAVVLDKRKRMDRNATWAALRDHRAAAEGAQRDADANAALKRAAAEACAPSCILSTPRADLTGAAAVRRMAEDLREGGARGIGGVTFSDMRGLGWTPAQLREFQYLASETAQQLEGAAA